MSKIAVLTNDLQADLINKNQERIDAVERRRPPSRGFWGRCASAATTSSTSS
ncbi:hypothetical protein [Streptomyces sp. enrichment culture]|uniref:hypothetical protein n=1 Tax=Streptomyces sp. enrichment culture TaxID=1795815 RepID=UPI003F5592C1